MTEWADIVARALKVEGTPIYIFSWPHVEQALRELGVMNGGLAIRHWLSAKTQPLPRLFRAWRATGRGIEVVSEFEYLAARAEGYDVDKILVNGVAKHHWLAHRDEQGLQVHFDSLAEVDSLKRRAAEGEWRVGFRVHVAGEHDPDEPTFKGQFGMTKDECTLAAARLRAEGVDVEGIHFHLRSNVETPAHFGQAIREIKNVCARAAIEPRYLDCGGGVPSPGESAVEGRQRRFDLGEYFEALSDGCRTIPTVEELWLENGRFVTSRSGVLAVSVLDVKERDECRYLICDGGRTNHAIVSDWETHEIEVVPERYGDLVLTTVCGPTCMAFDRLRRVKLPRTVVPGDTLLWHNAGAYHLPWETRFSHGLAAVLWVSATGTIEKVRARESFDSWWRRTTLA